MGVETLPDETRFWKRVSKGTGCWPWDYITEKNPYGQYLFRGKRMHPHKVSWILSNGREVPKKMCVMHKCDNPGCVNPDHLVLGTNHENLLDCKQKGRNAKGPKNAKYKLTEFDIQEIRAATGHGCGKRLAQKFGVRQYYISKIRRGYVRQPTQSPHNPTSQAE